MKNLLNGSVRVKAGVPQELGLRVGIIEDQYRFILHHKVMKENIQLLFIPPSSPDFNLIENLWKVLKEDFFNNILFKSLK